MERYSNYVVTVYLNDGSKFKENVLALSIYHACNRAHSKHHRLQPNISKYFAKQPMITC